MSKDIRGSNPVFHVGLSVWRQQEFCESVSTEKSSLWRSSFAAASDGWSKHRGLLLTHFLKHALGSTHYERTRSRWLDRHTGYFLHAVVNASV